MNRAEVTKATRQLTSLLLGNGDAGWDCVTETEAAVIKELELTNRLKVVLVNNRDGSRTVVVHTEPPPRVALDLLAGDVLGQVRAEVQ